MKRNLIYFIFLGTCLPAASMALELTANIDVESDYSTNSRLTQTNEVEEWVHRPGFNVGATHSTPTLTLDANYEFERRFYSEDSFKDENATTGRTTLLWNALPQRLDFTVSNSRTETPIESIDPNTPNNRQVVTNTQAGPILRFRTRGDDELQLQYLYGDRSNEVTGNDSTTHDLTARYKVVMSTTNELSFEVINRQTEYENPLAPELDATVGQVIWTRSATDLEFSIMGGYNQSGRGLGREDVDGSIYDLSLDWQARPNTAISIAAGRVIGDQANALNSGIPEFGENFNSVSSISNELFTNSRQEVSIAQIIGPNSLELMLFNEDEDYEDVLRDSENSGVRLSFTRALSPRMRLGASFQSRTQDYTDQNEEIDETRGRIRLTRDVGRRLEIALAVSYVERESDNPIDMNVRNYEEWLGTVSLTYALIERRRN